jgi:hypothetical protein
MKLLVVLCISMSQPIISHNGDVSCCGSWTLFFCWTVVLVSLQASCSSLVMKLKSFDFKRASFELIL